MRRSDPALREIAREDFSVYFEDAKARLAHAVTIAQTALRSLFLVNGGAILALMTLIGNTDATTEPRALFWAFVWFGIGMMATLAALITFALSQMFYMQSSNEEGWRAQATYHGLQYANDGKRDGKIGDLMIKATIVLAVVALTAFITGAFVALDAIT